MTIPPIDALPAAPSRNDSPDDFVTKADALMAALPGFVTDANAMAVAMDTTASGVSGNATAAAGSASAAAGSATTAQVAAGQAVSALSYMATSGSSFSLTTGSKAFTLNETSRGFAVNDQIVAVRRSDFNARLYATVTSYAANVLTVNVTTAVGSGGPFTDWLIYEAAFDGLPPAVAADIRGGTSAYKAGTPAALMGSAARQSLTDAATIVFNTANGYNATVAPTVSGRTIAAPTGAVFDGLPISIEIVNTAGGSKSVSWTGGAGGWDFGTLNLPIVPTTAGGALLLSAMYNGRTSKWDVLGYRTSAT